VSLCDAMAGKNWFGTQMENPGSQCQVRVLVGHIGTIADCQCVAGYKWPEEEEEGLWQCGLSIEAKEWVLKGGW